jgi:uncharacterized protein YaaR (DUF327 family)
MGENLKLNIDISQKKIEEMSKQVIKEIIESKIQETMNSINVDKIITDKINNIDNKLSQMAKDVLKKQMDDIIWSTKGEINSIVRDIVLEEVQKKPLTGNIYLKLDSSYVTTDYDY